MLSASLSEDQRRENWRDYIAQNLWAVGKLQLSDPSKYPWPSWAELTENPGEKPEGLSGEEIRQQLLSKWGGGEQAWI